MSAIADSPVLSPEAHAILKGWHYDPFHYLGPHTENGLRLVRAFIPNAAEALAVDPDGKAAPLARVHPDGLFSGPLPNGQAHYRLRAKFGNNFVEFEDPYRFPPLLSESDLKLLAEGTEMCVAAKLGAHPRILEGIAGVAFAVFAPNARRVSVVGDFNSWDGRWHQMRVRGKGFWEIFVPGAQAGDKYKFEIVAPDGNLLPLKSDPLAFAAELRPKTASVVVAENGVPKPQPARPGINDRGAPISIYEVHLGSWRRRPQEDHRWLSYRELAAELPAYVRDLGFTHVEFLPVTEHPFDGSWGYQPTGLFAPTSRFGSPQDFAYLVDACHKADLGVFIDWVPAHFPDDPHGLARFDGTALYEHADPKKRRHKDRDALIYDLSRAETGNFLMASGLYWLERFAIDGLRIEAVASMLSRDASRESQDPGNPEALAFLRRFNTEAFSRFPHATTIAEEATAWPMVSRPADWGGLGFGYKWNTSWMRDTLGYMATDPAHRKDHHERMILGLAYAFNENFVLPLPHDEVVDGKRSLLGRMAGDEGQRFANLRAYYGFMFGHPGKKLLFMGNEFAQRGEWRHDHALDWHHLDDPKHKGIQNLIRDLNRLYRSTPALHERDCDAGGFEWLIADDAKNSVFAWLRKGSDAATPCLVIVNFSSEVRRNYRVPVPFGGAWREVLNTDASIYGGANTVNAGTVKTNDEDELRLTLPPLAALFFTPEP